MVLRRSKLTINLLSSTWSLPGITHCWALCTSPPPTSSVGAPPCIVPLLLSRSGWFPVQVLRADAYSIRNSVGHEPHPVQCGCPWVGRGAGGRHPRLACYLRICRRECYLSSNTIGDVRVDADEGLSQGLRKGLHGLPVHDKRKPNVHDRGCKNVEIISQELSCVSCVPTLHYTLRGP